MTSLAAVRAAQPGRAGYSPRHCLTQGERPRRSPEGYPPISYLTFSDLSLLYEIFPNCPVPSAI
jgi:hypothetical protein